MSQNEDKIVTGESEIRLSMFDDDDRMSYDEYQREIRPNTTENIEQTQQQEEDCDCDCGSEFMEDMPTNETYSTSDGNENNDEQAIKFLTETGMLAKFDARAYFDLNCRGDDSNLGDIDIESLDKISEYKLREDGFDNFRIFEDPFEDESFNPADTLQEQLKKDPLPEI